MTKASSGWRWLPIAVLFATPAAARAQTLRGRVTDVATHEPVSGATVTLVAPDSQRVAGAVTDDAGAYSIAAPAGAFTVSVERLGYATATEGPVRLRANGLAELAIALTPQAIGLDTLGVSVEQQDPALLRAGFYNRRKDANGTFLDRDQILKRSNGHMEGVLSGLRGLRVVNDDNKLDVQLRGAMTQVFNPQGPKICLPLVYVDGLLLADGKIEGNGRLDLKTIPIPDLAGIELYSSEASVPLEFARGGGACGVLLFWTRSGVRTK